MVYEIICVTLQTVTYHLTIIINFMKKIYTFKKVLLVVAALFACNMTFAQLTETSEEQRGGDKNTDAVGTSYTLPGTYIAGKGSSQVSPMASKGLKLRTAQDGGRVVFNVNNSYKIVKLEMIAVGNYAADNADLPYVKVSNVTVDDSDVDFTGGEFPAKGAPEAATLTIENIKAEQSIAIYFDNSNASAGTQLNATWIITYEEAEASEPTITLTPDTLHLVPGVTYQILSRIVPGTFSEECVWYAGTIESFMDNNGVSVPNDIVELGENGLITSIGAGEIPVKLTWIGNPGTVEDTTVVIVSNFYPVEHVKAQSYDFTAMGDVELAIAGETYQIWNDGNNQCNPVQFCTNEGLENLAFQAVINTGNAKGWKIVDGQGLYLTGAGRCAAVGGLKTGQFIEIIYTGTKFATRDYTMDTKLGPDAGAAKTSINDEVGHAVFQVKDKEGETEGLMVGFEINTGQYVTAINVYEEAADPAAISEVETATANGSAVYNLMGMKVTNNTKGLLIKDGKKFIVK